VGRKALGTLHINGMEVHRKRPRGFKSPRTPFISFSLIHTSILERLDTVSMACVCGGLWPLDIKFSDLNLMSDVGDEEAVAARLAQRLCQMAWADG
jgi:hypothetical protein